MVGLSGLLTFAVAATLIFAGHLVTVQRQFITTTFGSHTVTPATEGRYNILLLGGDSGKSRWGLRPVDEQGNVVYSQTPPPDGR